MKKPFWVFGGSYYYPSGGMGDFVGDFATLKEALDAAEGGNFDWWDIVNAPTRETIRSGGKD